MPSDISQLIATAIAVKDDFQREVKDGYVLTGSREYKKVDLNKTSNELAHDLQSILDDTRKVVNGIHPQPTPSRQKCRGCGFRHDCCYAKN